jgi:hypothetical protein
MSKSNFEFLLSKSNPEEILQRFHEYLKSDANMQSLSIEAERAAWKVWLHWEQLSIKK